MSTGRFNFERFLLDSNMRDILSCINNHLFLDVSICDADLSEQMSKILYVIMYIIGYDFNFEDIKTQDETAALMHIIDELGPLIPKVLHRIILITEIAENQAGCDTTNNTLVLKELVTTLFPGKGRTQVTINPFSGLSNIVNPDVDNGGTSSEEYQRIIGFIMMGLGFLKYF